MKILLIKNDSTDNPIISSLTDVGISVDTIIFNEDGIEISDIHNYSAIIIDSMLPDIDVFELTLKLKAMKVNIPIIILSSMENIRDFACHTDKHIIKTSNNDEAIAKIHSIVKLVLQFGKVVINFDTRNVKVKGKQIPLTNKEYVILEFLAIRKNTAVTRNAILNQLYSSEYHPDSHIIDVFICSLRKKLADATGGINYIETVYDQGYMLKS